MLHPGLSYLHLIMSWLYSVHICGCTQPAARSPRSHPVSVSLPLCLLRSCSELGVHVDSFIAVVGHTLVVGSSAEHPVTGRKADVIQAGHIAGEVALRMLKPGGDSAVVADTMQKVAAEYGCVPIEGEHERQPEAGEGGSTNGILWLSCYVAPDFEPSLSFSPLPLFSPFPLPCPSPSPSPPLSPPCSCSLYQVPFGTSCGRATTSMRSVWC